VLDKFLYRAGRRAGRQAGRILCNEWMDERGGREGSAKLGKGLGWTDGIVGVYMGLLLLCWVWSLISPVEGFS